MSSIKESSLGLNYGWSYGETGWNSGMDENIVLTGFHANKQVKGILSTPPTTGVNNGDAYIVGSSPTGIWVGNYANVAIYDRGSWLFATPSTGVSVYNKANGCWYEYNNGWSLRSEAEESPYIKVKDFDFSTGYTITDSRQLLFYPTNQTYYQWSGALPKVVSDGSTPATSGGISPTAWVDRADLTLRSELAGDDGATLQAYKKSGVAWSVRRTMQEILDSTNVDLTGVSAANIQAALDYCYALSEFSVVKMPKSLSLSSGLTIRVDKVKLVGPSILDFSSMPSGVAPFYNYALTITSSSVPPYRQVHESLVDIELIGPNKAVQTCGIRYNSDVDGSGVSHIALRNVNIHGFAEGEMYQNHSYIITHYNCDLWGNSRAILHDAGYADYGERIGYIGCSIYNNDKILDANNPNGTIYFVNCSLDYNTDFGEVDAGCVTLTDCHMELDTYTSSYLKANGVGATIDVNGGWLLCTRTVPHNSDSFAYAAEGASVRIRPTKANSMLNSANRWGKGTGSIDIEVYSSGEITQNPTISADVNNLLADGGFESSAIIDDIFISQDTYTIVSRTTGANINLTTSTDSSKSGLRSLKAVKTLGAGSVCELIISSAIKNVSRYGAELWYKKTDSATGNMYISFAYGAGYKVDGNGVPSFSKTSALGSVTVPFTGSVDWTKVGTGEPVAKAPKWATHFLITISMIEVTAGSVYFDDVIITEG